MAGKKEESVVKQTLELFRASDLTPEEYRLCTAALVEKLHALPMRDTLFYDNDGKLVVNGRPVDVALAIALRESAGAALRNRAVRFTLEHVDYLAMDIGVRKVTNELQMSFAKAALWHGDEFRKSLLLLAQLESEPGLD